MRVLVLGATGVLGRQVVPRLIERGHEVRAVVRAPARAPGLAALGAELVPGDILEPPTLLEPARGCKAALHLATAVPRPGTAGDWALNDRIRREGTANLLAAAQTGGVRRYVQQSIVFLYAPAPGVLDETAPIDPASYPSAYEMEQEVMASSLAWCMLRGGLFYGPGTGQAEHWQAAARAGELRLPGDGSGWLSLIHVADMARAVVAALEAAPPGSLFNVVDDEPVTWGALLDYAAAQAGAAGPARGGPARASLRCSNARLRHALGWAPAYPSFRSGLA